jgi:TonB family protein
MRRWVAWAALFAIAAATLASAAQEEPAPSLQGPRRIRVGGQVLQSQLLEQTRPVYPPLARQARIQGTVRLQALIAEDGSVQQLEVISGHPLLQQAALQAVSQWRYRPMRVNLEPVEVVTTIDVVFALEDEEAALAGASKTIEPPKMPRVRVVRPAPEQLVKYEELEFPVEKLLQGQRGVAQLSVEVDGEGRVKDVEVTGGDYELGAAVEGAMKKWIFRVPPGGPDRAPIKVTLAFEAPENEEVQRQIASVAEKLLAESPENPRAHYHLGLVARARGDFAGAARSFRRTLFADDGHKGARESLLETLRNDLYDMDNLANELRSAAVRYPEMGAYRSELADLLMDLDDADGAIAEYSVLRSMDPENVQWCIRLAMTHLRKRGVVAAAAEVHQLSATCGAHVDLHAALGHELLNAGQFNAASALLEETLRIDPQNEAARNSLRNLAEMRRAIGCAQPRLAALARQKESGLGARLGLAAAHYLLQDDLEGGLRQFREILREENLPSPLLGRLAEGLRSARGLDFAIREVQRWVGARPNSSGPYVALASLLLSRGRVEEAAVMARHALSLNPRDGQARHFLYTALRAQGKVAETQAEAPRQREADAAALVTDEQVVRATFASVESAVRACFEGPGQSTADATTSANETSAVGSLRTLVTVNMQFTATYGGFATSLAQLGPGDPPSELAADLIDSVLASGRKAGYTFTYTAGAMDEKGKVVSFTVEAEPIEPGKTGKRFFFVDQSGVIRFETMTRAHAGSPPLQ